MARAIVTILTVVVGACGIVTALGCGQAGVEALGGNDGAVERDPLTPGDSGVHVPRPARFEPEDDPERLAATECMWLSRCAPALFGRHGWDTRDDCLTARRARSFEEERVLSNAGRVRFDRDALEACLGGYMSAGCAPPECPRFFLGTVSRGGACADSRECIEPGDFCTGEGLAACGVCAPKLGLFEPCGLDVECQSDRCFGLCAPQIDPGDQCDKICVPGGSCCAGSCVGPGMGRGLCQRFAARGEPCDLAEVARPACDLTLGLTCIDGMCAPVSIAAPGGACTAIVWCPDELTCADHRCPSQHPRPGEACDGRCRGGTECRHGRCVPPPVEGEPCVLAADCGPELDCVGERGARHCAPWRERECR